MDKSKYVSIERAPHRLEEAHAEIFTSGALEFLYDLITEFDGKIEKLFRRRLERRLSIKQGKWKPDFRNSSEELEWKIDDLPVRLQNRKLDLGDVSPANTTNFVDSLYAQVQGIQVDFDDGHCPTWRNTVQGLCNVTRAVHGTLPGGPTDIRQCPALMLRPRAFNMTEHHCMVQGKEVVGPLFDFAILMYHNANRMASLEVGPYFYLSKIEAPNETRLWNKIFTWTEHRLNLPKGTIKACVLIENILAAYRMEDILHSIKEHAIGLNCGIWDYSASIISKFGDSVDFLIPDRNKYVNMGQPFLRNYMNLLVNICHKRGALATGGMAAKILPNGKNSGNSVEDIVKSVKLAKSVEIDSGVDGFMIYDQRMVSDINELWQQKCLSANQLKIRPNIDHITPSSLLKIPEGGVTLEGLSNNITVALLFIYHWFTGSGVFYLNGAVEDSATAEISRSQIWQWIRHRAAIEGKQDAFVTRPLVYTMLDKVISKAYKSWCVSVPDRKRLLSSKYVLLEIISSREFIEYITTYLNDNHKFRTLHNKNDRLESKL
ncbi:malate synthase-like [Topomyia yanbarensis]|uniref:malate synthase-like n=1 Tax=Topomyia yanbarensis TaxID=2498891 RepID=UPI00273A7C75|nr:malate synthase-like [Topomyia yanbarensis]